MTQPDRSARILIAEDSPTQAARLIHVLEKNGHQVIATANGRLALEEARAQRPTLVISDVIMPEMNGYDLCRALKADADLASIPVILVTTLADPHDVIRGLECGADNFIVKPYDERLLISRIDFVLNNQQSQNDGNSAGVEVLFEGTRHVITAGRRQILNLLLSTYDTAIQRNQELSAAKEALRGANASLESANKELEAFSYSVSHDLRAPLRAIEGFTRTLASDHAGQLDAAGGDLLQRARSACDRMGRLIEDLLHLSRVTLSEMRHEPVDLSAIALAIASDLQHSQPDRRVTVTIAPGMRAQGDARLLQAALENLLGNAWKFTGKRDNATIEMSVSPDETAPVYFIRDNGAGFDMAYAEKLFGPFQRLHAASEFPGTGVGLATVQRIIARHGGRIWAESAPGEGATFYFTFV